MPPFDDLTDEELSDLEAGLARELAAVRTELADLEARVDKEGARLRKAAAKLGLNGALGAGGVYAAPFTMGLSLVLTLGAGGMAAWDVIDFVHDRFDYQDLKRRTAHVRAHSNTVADRYESITQAFRTRFGSK